VNVFHLRPHRHYLFLTKLRQVYRSCHILRSRYRIGFEDTRCLVSRFPCRSSCALTRGVRRSSLLNFVLFVGFPNSKTCRRSFFSEFASKRSDDYEWIFWACFSWSLITSAPFFFEAQEIDVNYQYCFAGKYNICIDADEINSWLESVRLV
jgi:hypothetical protein